MTERPPQNIRELLTDLEFAVRQNIGDMPPRVLEALARIDSRRGWRAGDDWRPSPPTPQPETKPDLFAQTEDIRW